MQKISYSDLWFFVTKENEHEIHFRITSEDNFYSDSLWECTIQGLWRDEFIRETTELKLVWDKHGEGDYFQCTLMRHNKDLHQGVSYTALFHEMLREYIDSFPEIRNLYSTSKLPELNMGFGLYPQAEKFWEIQVKNKVAEFIEPEQRFRAILR